VVAIEGDNANVITASQAFRFIISTQFSIGILNIPHVAVEAAGHDGWMTILAACVIIGLCKILIIALCNRFSGASILDIDKRIFQ
jgi:hypothetical protein